VRALHTRQSLRRRGTWPILGLSRPALLALAVVSILAGGCRQDMHDTPRYDPYEASAFFPDGRASRPLVAGTVARGHLDEDEEFFRGRRNGALIDEMPVPVTAELLARGRQRFDIYCSPCHARTGLGNGIVVQRGFPHPPSLHEKRLREAPLGYFLDVMTNGFGRMASYRLQVEPADRWAIVAYIRALQLSQHAGLSDAPAAERSALEAARE
jgi:mono/diheme cytochrome c family protein